MTKAVVIQPLTFPQLAEAPRPARDERPAPGRLAAIDIGSNSIHMIVVAPEPQGGYRVLGRERDMVRLGKTGFRGALSEAAIRDGLEALVKMTTLARLKGAERVVAVATSAVREASNGQDFLARVKAQTGIDVQLLTGIEEGRLIYRAVREAVDLGPGLAVIVDVGGGSTEWIGTQAGQAELVLSLPLGSLRCAGQLDGDPPPPAALDRLRRRIQKTLREQVPAGAPADRMIATSGTAACCADLVDLWGGRGPKAVTSGLREVRLKDLAQVVDRLREMRRSAIADLPPVGVPRSDSLLAGAILLQELAAHAGVDRFQVSDRALREGLVLEALGQPVPAIAQPADLRRRQVLQLAERTEGVWRHGQQTARLALRLFDVTTSLHGLGEREREWLEHSALLHDIGYAIQYSSHHKHAYYLITNAHLDAFDQREIEIIAHVARYHRGPTPKARRHPTLAALEPWQRRAIRKLAALLRLADALDRTHASRVDEIYCAIRRDRVTLEVLSHYDVGLELEAARERGRYFEKVFQCRLRLRQGLEAAQS